MPAKMERCVEDVKEGGGKAAKNPWAICTAALKKGTKKAGAK